MRTYRLISHNSVRESKKLVFDLIINFNSLQDLRTVEENRSQTKIHLKIFFAHIVSYHIIIIIVFFALCPSIVTLAQIVTAQGRQLGLQVY